MYLHMQNMDAHTNTHVCNHARGQRFKLIRRQELNTHAHACTILWLQSCIDYASLLISIFPCVFILAVICWNSLRAHVHFCRRRCPAFCSAYSTSHCLWSRPTSGSIFSSNWCRPRARVLSFSLFVPLAIAACLVVMVHIVRFQSIRLGFIGPNDKMNQLIICHTVCKSLVGFSMTKTTIAYIQLYIVCAFA